MKKVFVTRKLLKENEEKLKELFDVKLNSDDKIYSAAEIIEGSKNFDGILSSVTDPINSDTISKLSNSIKIIANGAVGFGNIDIKAAQEKGITVTNTPDVLTDATADIQILLLLGASRKAYEGRIAAETQSWKWSWDFLLGKQMSNKRLGILGMGRIGRAVAKRAKAFGMEIHYHNRSKLSPDLEDGAIYHKTIKDLFGIDDIIRVNDYIATTKAAEKQKQWESLKVIAEMAKREYPETVLGPYYLGRYYEEVGEPKKAMRVFQGAFDKEEVGFITLDVMLDKADKIKEDFGY